VEFWVHVVDTVLIFTILGLSLNLVLGFSGLASMAHAAFFGLGAYAAALLSAGLGWPFPLNLAAAILVTGAVAAVAALTPGMISNAIPAALSATISSSRRPKMPASPDFRRTTRRPDCAYSTSSWETCAWLGDGRPARLPTATRSAPARA